MSQERVQEVEEEVEGVRKEMEETRIGREEVEESLLDTQVAGGGVGVGRICSGSLTSPTQGLVEAMEDKLQEADTKHRQEVEEVHARLRRGEAAQEQVSPRPLLDHLTH